MSEEKKDLVTESLNMAGETVKEKLKGLMKQEAALLKVTPKEVGVEIRQAVTEVFEGRSENQQYLNLKKTFYDRDNHEKFWTYFLKIWHGSKVRKAQEKSAPWEGVLISFSEARDMKSKSGAMQYVYEGLAFGHEIYDETVEADKRHNEKDGLITYRHFSDEKYSMKDFKVGMKVKLPGRIDNNGKVENESGLFYKIGLMDKPVPAGGEPISMLDLVDNLNARYSLMGIEEVARLASLGAKAKNPYLFEGSIVQDPIRAVSVKNVKNGKPPYPWGRCVIVDDTVNDAEGDVGLGMMISPWHLKYAKDSLVYAVVSIGPGRDGHAYDAQGHGIIPVFSSNELEDFDFAKQTSEALAKTGDTETKTKDALDESIFDKPQGDTEEEVKVQPEVSEPEQKPQEAAPQPVGDKPPAVASTTDNDEDGVI